MNGSLVDLHAEVLRPKHQREILKELRCNVAWNALTVGMLWNMDLKKLVHSHHTQITHTHSFTPTHASVHVES